MIEVEYLLKAANQLGEGPLWHAGEKTLYWVDIEEDSIELLFSPPRGVVLLCNEKK